MNRGWVDGEGAGGAVSRRLFGYVHGGEGRSCVFDDSTGQPARRSVFFFRFRGRFSFSSSLVFSFGRNDCADPSFNYNDTGRSRFFRYVASFRFDDEIGRGESFFVTKALGE